MEDKKEGDKSNSEKIKEFIQYARSKGYSDTKIMQMFKDKGWKEEDIDKLTTGGKIIEKTKETYVVQQKPAETHYVEIGAPVIVEAPVRRKFKLIPYAIRFPLIWTLFFMILGILIQSLQAGSIVFLDFFGANYYNWIISLGAFVTPVTYTSPEAFVNLLTGHWYYFFFTGGIIALIWAFLVVLFFPEE